MQQNAVCGTLPAHGCLPTGALLWKELLFVLRILIGLLDPLMAC